MQLFEIFAEVIEWLLKVVPRFIIIRATHRGVAWVRGAKPRALRAGIRWYWPLVTEVETMPVARQTINLPTQVLDTADGVPSVIGCLIVYSITDIVKAMGQKNYDIDTTVADIAASTVAEIVTTTDYNEAKETLGEEFADKLTQRAKKALRQFGVNVSRVRVTDFSKCRTFKILGSELPS